MPAPIKIGVIGLGRMGRLYAQMLATQIADAQLSAIAEVDGAARAEVGSELNVPHVFADAYELIEHPDLQAVVIATPTSSHYDLVLAAAGAGKGVFCEKPLALTLRETRAMVEAVATAGVPLQVGFMRRFDLAYRRAKAMIDDGQIGYPVTFKSLSRDPFCPPRSYMDPATSGGLIIDMAIHDIDLAHWLMGSEVERVSAEGTTLVCEELASVGDIDNALVNMRFKSGALGNIEASRNAFYGYDIRTEVLGSQGALLIGAHQYTPVLLLTRAGAKFEVMPYLMERFGEAYRAQLQHFVDCLRTGEAPVVGGAEAYAACKVGIAATQSYHTGRPVMLSDLDTESL
jgi:scyllo-inositol 2-dehydrogenase (NAD+)